MITNHVVNLELSRKLYEIGIRKESIFSWFPSFPPGSGLFQQGHELRMSSDIAKVQLPPVYPAYTASELLEILPHDCKIDGYVCFIEIYRVGGIFYVQYVCDGNFYADSGDENICNALAKMTIYLVENGLMEAKNA